MTHKNKSTQRMRWAGPGMLVLALFGVACSAPARPECVAEAHEQPSILSEAIRRYGACRTYQDRGTLTVVARHDDGSAPNVSTSAFETHFDRASGAFLFEFHESGVGDAGHGTIWRTDNGEAQRWWNARSERVASPVDGLGGIAGHNTQRVPVMLLNPGTIPFPGAFFRLQGEESLAGIGCVKLSGTDGIRSILLWIGKADFTLRRIRDTQHFEAARRSVKETEELIAKLPPRVTMEQRAEMKAELLALPPRSFVSEVTTDFQPTFDRPIPTSQFEFVPPVPEPTPGPQNDAGPSAP